MIDLFVQLIRSSTPDQSRVELADLWKVFLRWKPELAASPEKRAELARWIGEAASKGALILPKGRKLYDRSALPPLPLWVAQPISLTEVERFDHRRYPWCEAMAFVASLSRLPSVDDALALNRFFVRAKPSEIVPVKERSHEIFGDEKRLHSVLTGILKAGLSYEKLGCFEPMLVPVHRTFQFAKERILIVENEAAFDSFCRWNQEKGVWDAIVFGRGIEVWKSVEFLHKTWSDRVQYDYFGDLDQDGIYIAFHLSRKLDANGRTLLPLTAAYRGLHLKPARPDDKTHSNNWRSALGWLRDAELITSAETIFAANKRIAQEAFGWETLRDLEADFFDKGVSPQRNSPQ